MKRWLLLVALSLSVALLGLLGWQSRPEPEPLIVMMDSPQLEHSQFDPSEMDAAILFLEDSPNSPFDIEFFFYDFDGAVTREVMAGQLAQGRQFFITTQPSQVAVATSELFRDKSNRLLINTSATSTLMSGRDDAMVRIIPDLQEEQTFIAQHILSLAPERVLVLVDTGNAGYTFPAAEVLTHYFDQQQFTGYHIEKISFLEVQVDALAPIIREPWDLLYILGGDFQTRIGNIGQFFHQNHPESVLLLTPWARSPVILQMVAQSDRPLQMISHFPWEHESPELTEYLDRFEQRFGYRPSFMAVKVRQGLEILMAAIQAVGTNPQAVQNHIVQQAEWHTSLGPIRLNAMGDALATFYVLDAHSMTP